MISTQREYKAGSANSMPALSYDRARLMVMVKRFPVEAQENIIEHLNDIEKQISIIQNNQSIKEVAAAVSKIENHAKDIFSDNKKFHQTMANTLKTMILNLVEPVKAIVEREAEKNDPTDFVRGRLSIPVISYNRSILMEIIEDFEGEAQVKLVTRLNDIESQLAKIKNNRSITDVADAVNAIQNHAKNIYTENRFLDETLANTLKTQILEIIKPLQEILNKEAENKDPTDSVIARNTNLTAELIEFRRQFLLAEQSFITRQAPLHKLLIKHLVQLNQFLIDDTNRFSPRNCYLVFFAPTKENQANEYWVLPFLSVLNVHLKVTGFQVVFGDEERKPGDSFYSFLDNYKDSNDIIFIGTHSTKNYFKREYASSDENFVLDTLLQKQLRLREESGIYPLLISGTPKTSFPDEFRYGSNVSNAYGGYIETLRKLTDFLFRKYIIGKEIAYDNAWNQFITNIQTLPESHVAVTREINEDYHRSPQLEDIRREVSCLRDQAQQELLLEESQVKSVTSFLSVNPNLPKNKMPQAHKSLNINFEVDEEPVGAPGGLNSPVKLVGGPGGANFDLLAGLLKKPDLAGFNSSLQTDDQIEEVPDVVESYRSPRPGGNSNDGCSIS